MSRSRLLTVTLILCLAAAGATVVPRPQANPVAVRPAVAPSTSVTKIVINRRVSPTFDGTSYGRVGPYEQLFGYVEGELDPNHPRNQRIVNLDKAPRNANGNVAYRADIEILKPIDLTRANGALILDTPNRGNKRVTGGWVNGGSGSTEPRTAADAGTGWLMRQGYTVVWVGWEPAVQSGGGRIAVQFPVAKQANGQPVTARTTQEFQFGDMDSPATATLMYPTASLDESQAQLTVKQYSGDPRTPVSGWEFVDETTIRIPRPAGFDAAAIYEIAYTAKDPVVLGIGLASIANTISHLRHSNTPDNPLAGVIERTIGMGFSQPGRVMRELINEGFNADEEGRMVFDGVISVLAGSRRTAVNVPFGITGDYSRQHETHLAVGDQFPFTYEVMRDPISGRTGGIFGLCRQDNTCPKTFHVDSDTEIFQARSSLVVTTPDGKPITLPNDVRAYFLAGSQHGPAAQATRPQDSQHLQNPLQHGLYLRALVAAMDAWVVNNTTPPASRYPSVADGTFVPANSPKAQFPAIPGFRYTGLVNELKLLDHSVQPPREGASYPVFVVAKDADGNNAVGLRHPLVEVPFATYTGWSLRSEGFAKDALAGLSGAYLPFAATRAERMASGDARPSLEERYRDQTAYVEALSRAANAQVRERILLQEDADRIVEAARRMPWPPSATQN
jgi:hypothetical protein